MIKQKICIIGGSLTGLVTAISLSKLNCEIDLIVNNTSQNFLSNRTTAVSEDNLKFIKNLNIVKSLKKEIWPCSSMKLYADKKGENFSKIFELDNRHIKKKILYMLENKKLIKMMLQKIKTIKSISLKNYKVSEISNSGLLKSIKFNNKNFNYNLIIICTGSNSSLVKNFFNDKILENFYDETSVTTIINHAITKNDTVRQIFLHDEIFALLPISNTKTSIVLTLKKEIKNNKDIFIKKKIKFYAANFFERITFSNKIEYKDLNSLIRSNYYHDRTLLFGDALHSVHPFVGQGFNMILRDLASLEKILSKKISLGLDIGSSDSLAEFAGIAKPRNFAYAIGIDLLKNCFSLKNESTKNLRNDLFKIINKNNFTKKILFNIADQGLKF